MTIEFASSGFSVDRRGLIRGTAALTAGAAFGTASAAYAQKEVPLATLMAPGELPDITVGSKDAKVTLIEYSSMSCPHCARFHQQVLPKLKEKYIDTGKVLLILREFPLNQIAAAVSMLTRCAGDNDKTAALVDIYFLQQDSWLIQGNAEPRLFEIAKQAGFTRDSFDKCLQNQDLFNKIVRARDKASTEFGIDRTPSFYINGKPFKGNVLNFDAFTAIIDPLLKENS